MKTTTTTWRKSSSGLHYITQSHTHNFDKYKIKKEIKFFGNRYSYYSWNKHHGHETACIRSYLINSNGYCLANYDTGNSITLEINASQKGLGAALVQEGHLVASGSKTLTECQSQYSTIKQETLAVIWVIEIYSTYPFGRNFTAVNDQQPLETIFKKSLSAVPPRLQRMLLKVQGYNFDLHYRPHRNDYPIHTIRRVSKRTVNQTKRLWNQDSPRKRVRTWGNPSISRFAKVHEHCIRYEQ